MVAKTSSRGGYKNPFSFFLWLHLCPRYTHTQVRSVLPAHLTGCELGDYVGFPKLMETSPQEQHWNYFSDLTENFHSNSKICC